MRSFLYVSGISLLFCLPLSFAFADVIPPEVGACEGKKAGDSCENNNQAGTCTESKCTKNDYSQGTPPKTVEIDCLKCTNGSGSDPKPNDGSGDESGNGSDAGSNNTGGGGGCHLIHESPLPSSLWWMVLLFGVGITWRVNRRS